MTRSVASLFSLIGLIAIFCVAVLAQPSIPEPAPPLLQEGPSLPPSSESSTPTTTPGEPTPQPTEGSPTPAEGQGISLPSLSETSTPSTESETPAETTAPQQLPPASEPPVEPLPPAISVPQGTATPSTIELLDRINRLENELATLRERVNTAGPQLESPAVVKEPFSLNILLSVNIVTFLLVMYLLWKSKSPAVVKRPAEETKPLRNIKDYMRRYLAQGYDVTNMKSFLITQGYPRDLVERAAKDMEGELSFKF